MPVKTGIGLQPLRLHLGDADAQADEPRFESAHLLQRQAVAGGVAAQALPGGRVQIVLQALAILALRRLQHLRAQLRRLHVPRRQLEQQPRRRSVGRIDLMRQRIVLRLEQMERTEQVQRAARPADFPQQRRRRRGRRAGHCRRRRRARRHRRGGEQGQTQQQAAQQARDRHHGGSRFSVRRRSARRPPPPDPAGSRAAAADRSRTG